MSKRGRQVLPKEFMRRVRTQPNGKLRPARKVEWFLRFLETGDGSRAVIEAGYDTAWPATLAARFSAEFQDLIQEAYFVRKSMDLMLAAEVGRKIMSRSDYQPVIDPETGEQLMGPDGKPVLRIDAKLEANAMKAAQWVESQGPLPPGVALKGTVTWDGGGGKETDWRGALQQLAARIGVEALLRQYGGRADIRAFLEGLGQQRPVLQVTEAIPVAADAE